MTTQTEAGETVGASPSRRFLRIRAVREKTGLPQSTIYYLQAKGEFPRSVKLSERIAGWDESEVDRWMASRIAERDAA